MSWEQVSHKEKFNRSREYMFLFWKNKVSHVYKSIFLLLG